MKPNKASPLLCKHNETVNICHWNSSEGFYVSKAAGLRIKVIHDTISVFMLNPIRPSFLVLWVRGNDTYISLKSIA